MPLIRVPVRFCTGGNGTVTALASVEDAAIGVTAQHMFTGSALGAKWSDGAREEALQWSLQRGSRSGRVAYQFARDWAGRHGKK